MGSSGSKNDVQVTEDKKKLRRKFSKEELSSPDIKQGEIPYRKQFNLARDSDYDDEIDSFAGMTKEEMKEFIALESGDEEGLPMLDDQGKTPEGTASLAKPRSRKSKKRERVFEKMTVRTEMDPQSRKALMKDVEFLRGNTPLNEAGLLTFNCFMHIFIIITRHSKEQHIKELRKTEQKRRRAFKLKSWKEYETIVQHELDIERVKYQDIISFVLNEIEIQENAYKASFMKYSMKRTKERQMKDARNMIMKEIDQVMLDSTAFNIEMLDRIKCKKILGFYEARKLDVLSILSNPFQH